MSVVCMQQMPVNPAHASDVQEVEPRHNSYDDAKHHQLVKERVQRDDRLLASGASARSRPGVKWFQTKKSKAALR